MLILDSGPLVAYFNSSDQYHRWALEQFDLHPSPYLTCEAVLSEADHLLEKAHVPAGAIFESIRAGALEIRFSLAEHLIGVERLKRVYKEVPMSLADACLVRMAELADNGKIMTLDSDFRIYRKNRRHVIPLIAPF
jgi:predicted nucleic acid-binding protein